MLNSSTKIANGADRAGRPRGDTMEDVDIPEAAPTFYDAVGGEETFRRLVHHFYAGVAEDPLLRPLYPEPDLAGAEERLRMRHAPFAIGIAERDAWLRHMRAAVDSLDLPESAAVLLWDYLEMAAHSMVNQPG